MKMDVIVVGVSHYDMEGVGKGASVKVLGDSVNENNYFGVSVSESTIDYEEIPNIVKHQLPAVFSASISMGSVKKNGSKKEVTTLVFKDLQYKHSLELTPVKTA